MFNSFIVRLSLLIMHKMSQFFLSFLLSSSSSSFVLIIIIMDSPGKASQIFPPSHSRPTSDIQERSLRNGFLGRTRHKNNPFSIRLFCRTSRIRSPIEMLSLLEEGKLTRIDRETFLLTWKK